MTGNQLITLRSLVNKYKQRGKNFKFCYTVTADVGDLIYYLGKTYDKFGIKAVNVAY